MPNHVTNRLEFDTSSDQFAKILERVAGKDSDGAILEFDFNRMIEMPAYLHDTLSGYSIQHWLDQAVRDYVGNHVEIDLAETSKRFPKVEFASSDDVAVFLAAQLLKGDSSFTIAHRQNENSIRGLREHGVSNWYDFAILHWKTKWNAYSVDIDRESHQITFDTAWSTPTPIIEKLSEAFPEIKITHSYFDEGHGFWGTDVYRGGELIFESGSVESERRALCISLKGYDPDDDDKEEEA
jgi:hypothetical protein